MMKYISMAWLMWQWLFSLISVILFKYLGFKGSFAIYIAIYCLGKYLATQIDNYWIFVAVYPLLGGAAMGGCIILPLYCGWRYFPLDYKTKVSGILISAYAVAPIFTAEIAKYIINPDDIEA